MKWVVSLFVSFTALPRNHQSKGSAMEILAKEKATIGVVWMHSPVVMVVVLLLSQVKSNRDSEVDYPD